MFVQVESQHTNSGDTVHICTENMRKILSNISDLSTRHSSVGDICSVVCEIGNDVEVVLFSIFLYNL